MLGTLAKVCFASSQNNLFIRESFAKVGYYESLSLYTLQLVKGYHLLPPGSPAGEWYRTFSLHTSRWQPSFRPQPNTMVLNHILAPAVGTA